VARYPPNPGGWATRPYGRDDLPWDEAKRQPRAVLYGWAAPGRYRTYTDLARQVTAIPWSEGAYTHHGSQMGHMLAQVSMHELSRYEDCPVISAPVIGADEGMPIAGFWTFVREELGLPVGKIDEDKLRFWVQEFKSACAYYGQRSRITDSA
jgi:hypothetical protein